MAYHRVRVSEEVYKELCHRKFGFGTIQRYLEFGLQLKQQNTKQEEPKKEENPTKSG